MSPYFRYSKTNKFINSKLQFIEAYRIVELLLFLILTEFQSLFLFPLDSKLDHHFNHLGLHLKYLVLDRYVIVLLYKTLRFNFFAFSFFDFAIVVFSFLYILYQQLFLGNILIQFLIEFPSHTNIMYLLFIFEQSQPFS